ncbi:nuclear RNA export factor 1-like [Anopheles marshallii]|uniref:nuclear RNA export factor 1-like n=1 Tax=Anopheles marshallii TaxID=1521116 RepID=UPI00237AEC4F|nr:nuclear RNA export factor 1-like [Anopheles marshallii]
MPKNLRNGNFRGRGGRNYSGDRFYDNSSDTVNHSHDDRTERGGGGEWNDRNRNDRNMTNVQRRVSFKPFSGGRGKGRITENQMRAHFNDDDEAMGGDTFDSGNPRVRMNNRNFDRQRRSGSPIPRGMHNDRNLPKKLMKGSQQSWYEIKIPHGQKYEKDFILRSIQQAISPLVFIPLYYKANDFFVSFFVEDYKVGSAILQTSRTIETPDGRRLTINVRNNQPPTQMNDQLKARMKQAMEKRYNPHTKALDLHKFHADSDLSDIFCSLARPQIMLAAMDIIAEHIPALEALNLNENRLYMLDHLRSMAMKLPHLKILHLAKNRIPYLNALDSLKNLKLVELNLEDNPLRKQFDDNTTYISEVRKRFPKVIKLDNLELPPPISFDIPEDNIKLPEAKASFLCDAAGSDIVRQFLEQYYAIYDSDNRQPLLEAYHEHVMFSHTINTSHQTNQQKMGVYMNGQRNIKQKTDLDSRCRLLKQGRLQVVSYLSSLPSTKHDLPTFAVDLTLFTPHMLQLTVNGTFKERKGNVNSDLLRSFQRTFVIVPANGGFCIRNEMIHINIATRLQEEKSFKPVSSLVMAQPATPTPTAVPTIATAPMVPDDNTKLQMIQALSAQTKMTTEWSKLCLQENNWDYQRAEFSFTELHKQNRIPPGAFITN